MLTSQNLKQYSFVNFPVSTGKYSDFILEILHLARLRKATTVCVANVHMFIEAYTHASFLKIIQQADIVTPDGKPLIWGLKFVYNIRQDRVAGMDLLPDLLKEMQEQDVAAFFYGGTAAMSEDTRAYLDKNFPRLKVAGFYNPPFGINDTIEDEALVQIKNSMPCIVFVVLGCPKQEKFMAAVKEKVDTVMVGIGGALPVMVGIQKRAPLWMQNVGLEWLFRLGQEPKRLFKRYFYTNSLFIWIFLKEYIKKRFLKL